MLRRKIWQPYLLDRGEELTRDDELDSDAELGREDADELAKAVAVPVALVLELEALPVPLSPDLTGAGAAGALRNCEN